MSAKLKAEVVSAFKMHGFTLRNDAVRYAVEMVAQSSSSQRTECIDRLIEQIQKQTLNSCMIEHSVLEEAVKECNQQQQPDAEKTFTVIDVFNLARFQYNSDRKKFLRVEDDSCELFGKADDKIKLFRERYTIILQRTSRHDLFTPAALGSHPTTHGKKFKLRPVEYLLGSSTKLGEVVVLGMLTQMREGKWYLEDITGAVLLDLSRANFHTGLFTDCSFVLVEGWYEDEVFHANGFGFPPAEPAKTTRTYFGNINFFGGPSLTCANASARLQEYEEEHADNMIVILSDVWLDSVKVLDKLRTLFEGYEQMPPVCFILIGSFLSKSYGNQQARVNKDCFKSLADLICQFPSLARHSRFVFVPSMSDIGPAHILPRPPIPPSVTEYIRDRLPLCSFTSNPCRLQYCTQEVVIFREDLVMKMCRSCVRVPSEGDIPTHFAKTLIAQTHLCPLPLHVEPVYWARDNAMWLYPLPDVVICADKYDPYIVNQVDCNVINPGSFPRSDWSFKVYIPSTRSVEDSRIQDD